MKTLKIIILFILVISSCTKGDKTIVKGNEPIDNPVDNPIDNPIDNPVDNNKFSGFLIYHGKKREINYGYEIQKSHLVEGFVEKSEFYFFSDISYTKKELEDMTYFYKSQKKPSTHIIYNQKIDKFSVYKDFREHREGFYISKKDTHAASMKHEESIINGLKVDKYIGYDESDNILFEVVFKGKLTKITINK